MAVSLYLDDLRDPKTSRDWVVVRSFDEAKHYCVQHGCPSYISFDHDLGDQVPSGYDLAKWLVETDLDHNGSFIPRDFAYNVHSANPVGAENITKLFERYLGLR